MADDFFDIKNSLMKYSNVASLLLIGGKKETVPSVSICIPTYKRSQLLKQAVDSALGQIGWDDYDVVVLDNDPERGCDTEQLMSTFTDKRLRYFKNSENLGMVGNWNRCFMITNAKYVVLLHDDDLLLPNFLQVCMNVILRKPEIGLLKPAAHIWKSDEIPHSLLENYKKEKGKLLHRSSDVSNLVRFVIGAPSGCLFNREKVIGLGGFNHNYYPSHDFCFIVLFSRYYYAWSLKARLSVYRVYANESANFETFKKFYSVNFELLCQLGALYRIPRNMLMRFIGVRFNRSAKAHLSLYGEKQRLDFGEYGLRDSGKVFSFILRYAMRIYVLMCEIFRTFIKVPLK